MFVYELTGMINEDMVYILAKEYGWPIPFHQSQFDVLALDDEWEMSRKLAGDGSEVICQFQN